MKKLDDLEEKLLFELETQHGKCRSDLSKLLNRLKNSERNLNCLHEQTSQLKSFASEIQLFLGTRQISERVSKEVESVKERINLPFKEAKVDQAQIQLRVAEMKTIKNIRLKLKKRFEVNKQGLMTYLSGCTMLSNGNVLIADYVHVGENVIKEYSEDGKHIRDIPCSDSPFDLTVIDHDRIAVTYGNKYIEILNLKNDKVEKKVKFDKECYGISYQNS
ncbi:Hypothetical predicted protein [Mytilus galloprovincialis]|uniref:Uncharacterized protein n=1 Tax=Mytilus galloprovincialis TaxID=29158 RepID=A0A8B6FFT8_MYTGA|nr:Hypothetical predicted protein [Mytilus galloprovincialis]